MPIFDVIAPLTTIMPANTSPPVIGEASHAETKYGQYYGSPGWACVA